jgi:hypothetical protein
MTDLSEALRPATPAAGLRRVAAAYRTAVSGAGGLPAVLVLRAGQMLLMLAVLKLTHHALGAADFIIFNAALFALGIASAFMAPSLRALWRTGERDVALRGAAVNVLVSMTVVGVMFLANRPLFATRPLPLALAVCGAAAVYCGAKAVERTIYAYGFTQQDYTAGFSATFLFIAAELAVLLVAPLSHDLGLRLVLPALLFAVVLAARTGGITRARLRGAWGLLRHARGFARAEFANGRGVLAIAYIAIFTVAGMIERVYPSLLPPERVLGQQRTLKDYLLVLAYGVAFQSLLSIAVDWARPRVVYADRIQPTARRSVLVTAGLVAAACAGGCLVGYPVFHRIGMVPAWMGFGLWSLILLRFTAQIVLFLCQVDLVVFGRLARAIFPWTLIIATQVAMIRADLSAANLQRALAVVVVETSAIALVEAVLLFRRLRQAGA